MSVIEIRRSGRHREPHDHKPIANAIERSPRRTADCFEHRVIDLPDDFGWLWPFKRALSRVAENTPKPPGRLSSADFIAAMIPI